VQAKLQLLEKWPACHDGSASGLCIDHVPVISDDAHSAQPPRAPNGFPEKPKHDRLFPLTSRDVLGWLIACATIFIAAGAVPRASSRCPGKPAVPQGSLL
jgi:hypothetical protein